MAPEAKSNFIKLLIILAVIALVAAGYFYFFKPVKKSAVGTTEKVSESVPTIATNPADKVPEVNPLDRANPFKYTNPLR